MSRGRKSPAIRLSKIPKNKGHTPTKEHMTSAAEQHGAAASRNAFAPRMLYSFAVVHAPLSGCAQADSRQASQSLSGINGHPFRFCCCLLGPSTRKIHAAFIFPYKYDLFFRKKRSRAIRTRLRKVEEIA